MLKNYIQLMRLNKPIGIFLLLWPTLWALWLSARGMPSIKNLFIFIAGVILMRTAGCVINDIADRNVDKYVIRTSNRPITTQKISVTSAFILFSILCFISFLLVLMTNRLTIYLSGIALLLACLYPFTKRFTYWPQLFLGIAFSFSVPMAFAAQTNSVSPAAVLLMLITVLWTITYDTQYAMTDRVDDVKIGIKSTAILFGNHDRLIIFCLQLFIIALFIVLGVLQKLSLFYFISIFIASLLIIYQTRLIATQEPVNYFRAFLNNQWIGCVIFVGIFLSYIVPPI